MFPKLEIYFSMNKVDEGINYIKNTEITKKEELYKLVLSSLKEKELFDDWLKIYNKYKIFSQIITMFIEIMKKFKTR